MGGRIRIDQPATLLGYTIVYMINCDLFYRSTYICSVLEMYSHSLPELIGSVSHVCAVWLCVCACPTEKHYLNASTFGIVCKE